MAAMRRERRNMDSRVAVIWDLDGVLVDSASLHLAAWQAIAKERGLEFTEQDFYSTFGLRSPDIIQRVLGDFPRQQVEAMTRRKEQLFRALVKDGYLHPLPGACMVVNALAARNVRQAVATSAPRRNVDMVLDHMNLSGCFQALVSGEDVSAGKPEPEVFLKAAQRLRIPPEKCVVIEDAPDGVLAAKRAGMRAVAVTTSHRAEELHQADLVLETLEQIDLAWLLKDGSSAA